MLIFAAIVATFIYGMIAATLGTILPDLSNRFQLTPRQMERSPSPRRSGSYCLAGCRTSSRR